MQDQRHIFQGYQELTTANETGSGLMNQSRSLVNSNYFFIDPSKNTLTNQLDVIYPAVAKDEAFVNTGEPVFSLSRTNRPGYCFSVFTGISATPNDYTQTQKLIKYIMQYITDKCISTGDLRPTIKRRDNTKASSANIQADRGVILDNNRIKETHVFRDLLMLMSIAKFVGTATNAVNLTEATHPKGTQLAVIFAGGHTFKTYYDGVFDINESLYLRSPPLDGKKLTTGPPDSIYRKNAEIVPLSNIVKGWASVFYEDEQVSPTIMSHISRTVETICTPMYYGTCIQHQDRPGAPSTVVRD